MRQWLAQSETPFDRLATNRTASALADASAALDWMTEHLAEQRITSDEDQIILYINGLPKEIQRRLLLMALNRIDPYIVPRGDAVERLVIDLKAGKAATIGDIMCRGGDDWRFTSAPPRRTSC